MKQAEFIPAKKQRLWRKRQTSLLAESHAAEARVEARQAPAAVEQLLLAAGPGRVRPRVDVEIERVAFLAPGRPGHVLGPP